MSSSDTPTSILQSITLNCVSYTCWDVNHHNISGYDSTYLPHYNRTCYGCSLYDDDGRPLSGFPEKNCTTIACDTFGPGANTPKYIFIIPCHRCPTFYSCAASSALGNGDRDRSSSLDGPGSTHNIPETAPVQSPEVRSIEHPAGVPVELLDGGTAYRPGEVSAPA